MYGICVFACVLRMCYHPQVAGRGTVVQAIVPPVAGKKTAVTWTIIKGENIGCFHTGQHRRC